MREKVTEITNLKRPTQRSKPFIMRVSIADSRSRSLWKNKTNEAFLELERHNKPVLELTAAVQQVKASPVLSANFQHAINFIALIVTPIKVVQ